MNKISNSNNNMGNLTSKANKHSRRSKILQTKFIQSNTNRN